MSLEAIAPLRFSLILEKSQKADNWSLAITSLVNILNFNKEFTHGQEKRTKKSK